MEQRNSIEYYQGREIVERSMARAAIDPAIAKIHSDMADRYAGLVSEAHAAMFRRRPVMGESRATA